MNVKPKKTTKEDKEFWAFVEKKSAEAQAREQWKNVAVSLTGRPKAVKAPQKRRKNSR